MVIAIGEEEKGWLFILEDFLNGVVVEGDDFGVDVEDKDEGQDESFGHGFQVKIYKLIHEVD